jgi:hypothetical protein
MLQLREAIMDRRHFVLGSMTAAGAAMLASETQAATWVSLGRRRVNGLVDFDQISVGRSAGIFNAIRLKVTGNDLLVYDVVVRYGNGADDNIPVRLLIPQGGQTRIIDLRANNRFIRHVRFGYGKFFNLRGPTYVELLGRKP